MSEFKKVQSGYVAIYAGKRIELYADSLYAAKLKAIEQLRVPENKQGLLYVTLVERPDGSEISLDGAAL